LNKLSFEKILENVPKNRVNIDIFEKIDSTNDEAKRITNSNEFNIIIAEEQSKGRGRKGNNWFSPNSGNIYMTLFTENQLSEDPASLITGVVCRNSIRNINERINISLKWPNDILYKNKKVGGILVEKEHYEKKIKTIIGIGINLNLKNKESSWGDLSEFNLQEQRNELVAEIINNLVRAFDKKNNNWKEEWLNGCMHINREIQIYDNKNIKKDAIFRDIDDLGNAIIETDNGLEVFRSGHIKIKGIY
tara:strand:- start:14 stop:757 length:744 start_codon:yes stop_codon:yes gene_type:complete